MENERIQVLFLKSPKKVAFFWKSNLKNQLVQIEIVFRLY